MDPCERQVSECRGLCGERYYYYSLFGRRAFYCQEAYRTRKVFFFPGGRLEMGALEIYRSKGRKVHRSESRKVQCKYLMCVQSGEEVKSEGQFKEECIKSTLAI